MKSTRYAFMTVGGLLAILFLASCNNSFGAFASIKQEVAQNKSSDFKQTTVVGITKAFNNYYAVMNAVYCQTGGSGGWSTVSLPDVGASYACTGMAYDGANLYIAETATSGNVSGIYSSANGSSWTKVDTSAMGLVRAGDHYDQVDGIWYANGNLFAQAQYFATTGTTTNPTVSYRLFYWNGSLFDPATGIMASASSTPVMSVASFAASNYYCAYGSKVLWSTSPDFTVAGSQTLSSTVLGLKLSQSTAGLFAWTASSIAWNQNDTAPNFVAFTAPSLSTDNVISDVQEVPVAGPSYHLLVGTGTSSASYTANGYFESTSGAYSSYSSGSGGSVAGVDNSTFDTLFSSRPVVTFFYDGDATAGRLLAGIAASGLTTSSYGLVTTTFASGSTWHLEGWSAE